MISKNAVVDFTEKIKPLIDEIEPSFFEITVAMAFDHFVKEEVDIAVIETGLGGRLDSTNIITPEISVITNIGWDHMNLLGDSLEKIAIEKAGIIKQGIPVVIGETLPETKPVFENIARERNATISFAAEKRQAINWHYDHHLLTVEVADPHKTDHELYTLDLPGIYQCKNLVTVLETCLAMTAKGWKTDRDTIHKALKQVRKLTGLHGRWETIHMSPLVILDVAHNPDGIRQLVQQLEITDHHELHLVIGMVKDKQVEEVLQLLPKQAHYYFTKAQIPRALSEQELAKKAGIAGLEGHVYPEVNMALKAAMEKANEKDMIIVCGSVFLVGEVEN
jgi:dihydrofolate synthase/folylpolyglutamate synthase